MTFENPLVSVVIPTIKKRKKLLKRAVASVKAQTYKNIEIIIVDGEGINPNLARNNGVIGAKGELIAFLDDDDEFLPRKIELQVDMFKYMKNIALVTTWITDKRFDKEYVDRCKPITTQLQMLKNFHYSSTSSYMIEKSLFKWIGGFDVTFEAAEEYDMAIRASCMGNLYCVQLPLVKQYKSEKQITKNLKNKKRSIQKLLKKHKWLYKSFGLKQYLWFRCKFFIVINVYRFGWMLGKRLDTMIRKVKE